MYDDHEIKSFIQGAEAGNVDDLAKLSLVYDLLGTRMPISVERKIAKGRNAVESELLQRTISILDNRFEFILREAEKNYGATRLFHHVEIPSASRRGIEEKIVSLYEDSTGVQRKNYVISDSSQDPDEELKDIKKKIFGDIQDCIKFDKVYLGVAEDASVNYKEILLAKGDRLLSYIATDDIEDDMEVSIRFTEHDVFGEQTSIIRPRIISGICSYPMNSKADYSVDSDAFHDIIKNEFYLAAESNIDPEVKKFAEGLEKSIKVRFNIQDLKKAIDSDWNHVKIAGINADLQNSLEEVSFDKEREKYERFVKLLFRKMYNY